VISATAATKFFPGLNPIGHRFGQGGESMWEVLGVVANARVNDLHEVPPAMAYYSLEQKPDYVRTIEVRAQGDPQGIEQSVRTAINAAASNLPVLKVKVLSQQVDSNLLREKLIAKLGSSFGVLALALACLGVYGVLSYAITRRTPEIGIRIALGAERKTVQWMVMREALGVIFIGLGSGMPVAIGATRLVDGLIYGMSAGDPTSMTLGALVMLTIGLMAALLPAWRASKVDPNIALRYE